MTIVIASDSYKESLTAKEACWAIEEGMKKALPNAQFVRIPMADGGEGTMQTLLDACNGLLRYANTLDPLGHLITSQWGYIELTHTAIIEMATTSGLELVPPAERNPLITTTFGTGQLIKEALDNGAIKIIIGIGGSATNDGGAGMLQALGAKLCDAKGNELPFGGGALAELADIDLSGFDKRLQQVEVVVACDVDNPLTGPNGASFVFGKQKGASPSDIITLDNNLKHYANLIKATTGTDVEQLAGGGAAGGLGAALVAFLKAQLENGFTIVAKETQLEEHIAKADLVITGEGSIDEQSLRGKTPYGVAQLASKHHIPVIALVGSVGQEVAPLYQHGFNAIFSIMPRPTSLADALKTGKENLKQTAFNVGKVLALK